MILRVDGDPVAYEYHCSDVGTTLFVFGFVMLPGCCIKAQGAILRCFRGALLWSRRRNSAPVSRRKSGAWCWTNGGYPGSKNLTRMDKYSGVPIATISLEELPISLAYIACSLKRPLFSLAVLIAAYLLTRRPIFVCA